MVRVTADTFLVKVAEFYEPAESVAVAAISKRGTRSNGSVAITCKSVPVAKIIKTATAASGEHVLLFRACKYGNNKHKRKISTTITAAGHAQFHAALSHIVKTRADVAALKSAGGHALGAKRSSKGKKATA